VFLAGFYSLNTVDNGVFSVLINLMPIKLNPTHQLFLNACASWFFTKFGHCVFLYFCMGLHNCCTLRSVRRTI